MNKYENHEHEWREEENKIRAANKYKPYIDPRDPGYISLETEVCPTCGGSRFSGYGTGYDAICDTCAGNGEVLKDA